MDITNGKYAFLQLMVLHFNIGSIEFDCDDELFATAGVSRRIKVFDYSSVRFFSSLLILVEKDFA